MANPEHLEILKQGVEDWNQWRKGRILLRPDLSGANLNKTDLSGIDLKRANLRGANLRGANLDGVYIGGALVERRIFSDNDLSAVRGIDIAIHMGPSTIGVAAAHLPRI